ncbi:acyltransferase [Solibacillus sp. NPDC093137]|uniref:acyltransferase n=1 Tax=Solibacillus sp. NPDC093137 TaxID=3390678 RepID=UPI003CFE8C6C
MKKKLGILIAKIVGYIFYDKKYFKGRYFESSSTGWNFILKCFFEQKILGKNRNAGFPVNGNSVLYNPNKVHFHIDDLNNFQSFGCYFQNFSGDIYIGKGTYIAPNVGIITSNHDLMNLDNHYPGEDVVLGENCWIGMNSVILPGVTLGNNTIVAAGSVVTKSFIEGSYIIGGSPAKIIRKINKNSH